MRTHFKYLKNMYEGKSEIFEGVEDISVYTKTLLNM